MAKNRRIPFGYQMINGEITTHPKEVYAVSKIFAEYLKGRSLLDISKELQADGIPYHPCEDSTWNKNMVKRILENDKYLGTEIYPQIISPDIIHRANNKKLKKATNLCIVPDELKDIRNMTICAECRKMLFRNHNGSWNCKTYRCGAFEFKATDQMILSAVLNMLNTAIANPSLLDTDSEMSVYTRGKKARKLYHSKADIQVNTHCQKSWYAVNAVQLIGDRYGIYTVGNVRYGGA